MNLASEAPIATKIRRMDERGRRGHPELARRGIDPCRLALEGDPQRPDPFSFLVLGDSGSGRRRSDDSPQRQVAEGLFAQGGPERGVRFVLHTGDVVYLVGSSEQYRQNFITPYREWLVGGDDPRRIAYDRMTFRLPFLPVPGNHDYYDLPVPLGLISLATAPLRRLLGRVVDLDVGCHGSFVGEAYARAFLDGLGALPERELGPHLDRHYDGLRDGVRCLNYRPGRFTRLPNRYYRLRWAGVDVFALDSNTFNQPLTPAAPEPRRRERLRLMRTRLEAERASRLRRLDDTLLDPAAAEEERDDLGGSIERIEEEIRDVDKQLAGGGEAGAVDQEQLNWLEDGLVASWSDPAARGRVLVLHHPPYVTEASKWDQGQTLAVRHQLRRVLDQVARRVGARAGGRPLVSLGLGGHAHCLEVLRTGDTGHGDARIPWVICGGGGYSLRRQRPEGAELLEGPPGRERPVARSELFVGRSGQGSTRRRPYSALRVDVAGGTPLRFRLTPLLAEKVDGHWRHHSLAPIMLPCPAAASPP